MVGVILTLFALFIGLALFMTIIWNGIQTDSARSDLETLWEKYEEIIKKEDIL
ncbi:MAG: hypothetical protein WCF60_12710 [Anaerobacillus sp.]